MPAVCCAACLLKATPSLGCWVEVACMLPQPYLRVHVEALRMHASRKLTCCPHFSDGAVSYSCTITELLVESVKTIKVTEVLAQISST